MKKKILLLTAILCSSFYYGQQNEKVGIGTDNPKATVDVNGGMIIREVKSIGDDNTAKQLFWNKRTKEVQFAGEKPFTIVEYSIKVNFSSDANLRDFLREFDTGIPTDRYHAVMASVYPTFDPREDEPNPEWIRNLIGIRHVEVVPGYDYHVDTDGYMTFNDNLSAGDGTGNHRIDPFRVASCFKKDGTWRLTADYIGARPPRNGHKHWENPVYTWHFKLLVVDKAYGVEKSFGRDNEVVGNPPVGKMENPLMK